MRIIDKKFDSHDFNLLYDDLWRYRLCAENQAMNGKNKDIRLKNRECVRSINWVIQMMENIEERRRKEFYGQSRDI